MSFKFGKVIKAMLDADSTVRSLLTGGIHPDEIPATIGDIRDKPAAAYWLISSNPRQSITRTMPVADCVLGFRFYGATVEQKQAALAAIASLIETNRHRYSDGTDTIAGLRWADARGGTERVPDGNDEPAHYVDFTISGAVGT